MAGKKKLKGGGKTEKMSWTSDKNRFGFNIAKDLVLLKVAVNCNPWQLGKEQWIEVAKSFSAKYGADITSRTVKQRVNLLLAKFEKEALSVKTGTEEEISERGSLLTEIQQLVEISNQPINIELGADVEVQDEDQGMLYDARIFTQEELETVTTGNTAADRRFEKQQADEERERALGNMKVNFIRDLAPEAMNFRRKRMKLTPEDELIKIRQDHEIATESKKLKLQEKLQRNQYDLEMRRLELEEKRETRLAEENKRRDEIAQHNLEVQKQMFSLINALANGRANN